MRENITDFLGKINSRVGSNLSTTEVISLSVTIIIISISLICITIGDIAFRQPISIIESREVLGALNSSIVASKNGSTYFFSWCSGVERIKAENLITFLSEDQAKKSGRRLSKTCER